MFTRPIIIVGAAAALALTLSGCSSTQDKANQAIDSAQAVVSSAAAQASAAVSEAVEKAQSAAAQASAVASEAASAMSSMAGQTPYTMADVKAHATAGDCWVAINGKVYDLTKWEDKHPGGADKITALCGTDASAAFTGQHDSQPAPNAALIPFQIGKLS
jgi:cytochrome b involved in lipid metabolism